MPQPSPAAAPRSEGRSMELAGNAVGPLARDHCKVTIVGAGSVGVAAATAILTKGLGKPLVLIDVKKDRVMGETIDLQHGVSATESEAVIGGTDYSLSEGSKVCIITAGKRQAPGQTRLELLRGNTDLIKKIVTELVKYCPDAVYVIASNPVDVITYAAWRLTGLPLNRVIGTGTHLDCSRFKYYISEFVSVPVHNVEAYIIGEHGESSVPVWSSVRIAGQPFCKFESMFSEDDKAEIHGKVVNSAAELIALKGYTAAGIGIMISDIVESIVLNKNKIMCVSTLVKDVYGVDREVFTSIPCLVGANGISYTLPLDLTNGEVEKFRKSAEILAQSQDDVEECIS